MTEEKFRVDPASCPLCGQPNQCAMERARLTGEAQPPCWCTQASFPPALVARLPEKARGRACICAACATPTTTAAAASPGAGTA